MSGPDPDQTWRCPRQTRVWIGDAVPSLRWPLILIGLALGGCIAWYVAVRSADAFYGFAFFAGLVLLIPFARPVLGATVFVGAGMPRYSSNSPGAMKIREHPRSVRVWYLSGATTCLAMSLTWLFPRYDVGTFVATATATVVVFWVVLTLEPLVRYVPPTKTSAIGAVWRHPLGAMTIAGAGGAALLWAIPMYLYHWYHGEPWGHADLFMSGLMAWTWALMAVMFWEGVDGTAARAARAARGG